MVDVERVPTDIPGLDKLLDGGFPTESVVLVTGGAGCGKTILSSQFLWNGLENGETCRFISMEEAVEDIITDAQAFGWDFTTYQDDDQFDISYVEPTSGERGFMRRVNDMVRDENVSRLVIDSISIILGAFGSNEPEMRDNMYTLLRNVKESGTTTLMTSEIRESEDDTLSRYNVAEFVVDGIIKLYYHGLQTSEAEYFRSLAIRKMRRTAHIHGSFPFEITDDGIIVHSDTPISRGRP